MKPAPFAYHRADNLAHAATLLAEHGDDAKLLAGGQSLIAAMNFRLARPRVLIDISNVVERNRVTEEAAGVRISAPTVQRHAERHSAVRSRLPVLAHAIEHIAHFQIRNKGTVGGSIANADPASELPAMSLLLDAELEVTSAGGSERIAAEDLFITYMTTALQPDQVLASILFRAPPAGHGWGFHEIARRAGDFAMAGAAAVLARDANGACNYARVVLFGLAPTPVRAKAAEASLSGHALSADALATAAGLVGEVVDPETDVHVTEAYRRQVAPVLALRALTDAARGAGALS